MIAAAVHGVSQITLSTRHPPPLAKALALLALLWKVRQINPPRVSYC
jgi:hypothetical protein